MSTECNREGAIIQRYKERSGENVLQTDETLKKAGSGKNSNGAWLHTQHHRNLRPPFRSS